MITITLCGSGKFREAVHAAGKFLQERGIVVLIPPLHQIEQLVAGRPEECKQLAWKGATFAHFNRIAKADIVFIVNPEGYVGASTTLELGYAVALGKLIFAMQPDSNEPARNGLFDVILGSSDPYESCQDLLHRTAAAGLS
ncbi:MAG: nucleoside 2-deoxyribosyltransferase [Pyrinomonadaceae bacterium]